MELNRERQCAILAVVCMKGLAPKALLMPKKVRDLRHEIGIRRAGGLGKFPVAPPLRDRRGRRTLPLARWTERRRSLEQADGRRLQRATQVRSTPRKWPRLARPEPKGWQASKGWGARSGPRGGLRWSCRLPFGLGG